MFVNPTNAAYFFIKFKIMYYLVSLRIIKRFID